jgi:hypothetical protein
VAHKLAALLKKHGFGPDGDQSVSDPPAEQDPLLATLAAASIQGRVATGPRAGQRLLRLGDRIDPEDLEYLEATPPPRCANAAGLSLHADVAIPARDRNRLERLARYCGRPPIATDRLTQLDDGRLCYRLKHRWRDGTTHVVLDPIDLLERLATFVPSPRLHMVRYHGILAPCASWRDHVVPRDVAPETADTVAVTRGADTEGGSDRPPEGQPGPRQHRDNTATSTPARTGAEPRPKPQTAVSSGLTLKPPSRSPSPLSSRPRRLSWEQLLRRVFGVDALACPRCGERMRLLAVIQDPAAIRAILDCLNLPSRAPPLAPARQESTEPQLDFGEPPIYED